MDHSYPILEFDTLREAMIEPRQHPDAPDFPEGAVACYFYDVIEDLVKQGELRVIYGLPSEIGLHSVYELTEGDKKVAVFHPGMGAPFGAAFMEEMIAYGTRKFIICGGCGVLDGSIAMGNVVVLTSAVRDEGTSYHYLPPSREVAPSQSAVTAIKKVLDRRECPYILGKTWTTDAPYRETKGRIARRIADGCKTVEMEAAAFFAVAQFRGVEAGQIVYGGDDLSGEQWDKRGWNKAESSRQKLFRLAVEACLEL